MKETGSSSTFSCTVRYSSCVLCLSRLIHVRGIPLTLLFRFPHAQIALNIFMTSLIMNFIKHVCRVPLRMSDASLLIGDDAIHGESAYALDLEMAKSTDHHDLEAGASEVTHRNESKDEEHSA